MLHPRRGAAEQYRPTQTAATGGHRNQIGIEVFGCANDLLRRRSTANLRVDARAPSIKLGRNRIDRHPSLFAKAQLGLSVGAFGTDLVREGRHEVGRRSTVGEFAMSRIIAVDDHPVFRRGRVALLRTGCHDVIAEPADGLEAIAAVSADPPEVVLMDLSMPTRDGFEATAHITARHPGIKVLVITLFDDQDSIVRALESGASGYVSKQTDPDQILGRACEPHAPPATAPEKRRVSRREAIAQT